MQLHELFSLDGNVWFKKGNYYYTLGQVQTIMRDVLRAQPENAERILQDFKRSDKPNY
jgi:hypothetical protein